MNKNRKIMKKKRRIFEDLELIDYYKDRKVLIEITKKEFSESHITYYINIELLRNKYLNCTDYVAKRSMCLIDSAILACSEDLNDLMKVLLQHKCKRAKRWLLRTLSDYPFRETGHTVGEYINQRTGFLDIEKAEKDQEEIWRKESN